MALRSEASLGVPAPRNLMARLVINAFSDFEALNSLSSMLDEYFSEYDFTTLASVPLEDARSAFKGADFAVVNGKLYLPCEFPAIMD